jgi:hypothetical protein
MADRFLDIGRNELCWCGSRIKYKRCHGDTSPRHPPGTPLPPDPPGQLWLTPDTAVDADALVRGSIGAPLYLPEDAARPRPEPIQRTTAELAAAEPKTTVTLAELAASRDDLLAAYGLTDPDRVEHRAAELTPADLADLRYGILDLVRATFDRLVEEDASPDPPSVVRAERIPAAELIGHTMLWADHYLVPDAIAEALTLDEPDRDALGRALLGWLDVRELAAFGLVVPVFDSLVAAMTADAVIQQTEAVLDDLQIVSWVERQIIVEGPSAREVIFLEARDDLDRMPFFIFLGRVDPSSLTETSDGGGTFGSRMLQPYLPEHDYQPWIAQERHKVANRMIQEVIRETTVSDAVGGTYVTNSLFRARLLDRLGRSTGVGATIWADVPSLPDADPALIARIASEDESVETLRRTVGRTLQAVERVSGAAQVAAVRDLVGEIEDRTHALEAEIRSGRRWERVGAGTAGAAVALGGVAGGPLGSAATALGAVGLLGKAAQREAAARRTDAYVFWLAERSLRADR